MSDFSFIFSCKVTHRARLVKMRHRYKMWWKVIVRCALNKTARAITLLPKCTDGLLTLVVLVFASIWTHFSTDAQHEMSSVAANCLTTDDEIKANCAKSKPSCNFARLSKIHWKKTFCQPQILQNCFYWTRVRTSLSRLVMNAPRCMKNRPK